MGFNTIRVWMNTWLVIDMDCVNVEETKVLSFFGLLVDMEAIFNLCYVLPLFEAIDSLWDSMFICMTPTSLTLFQFKVLLLIFLICTLTLLPISYQLASALLGLAFEHQGKHIWACHNCIDKKVWITWGGWGWC